MKITKKDISDNWEVKKLIDVLDTIKGGCSAKQSKEKGSYPVSRIETIADGTINPKAVRYVDLSEKEYKKHVMQKGDILFSNINSPNHVGKTAIFTGNPKNLIHGMNLILLRANKSVILPYFLFYILIFFKQNDKFKNMCKEAINQASLSQKDIKPILIPIPPLKEQEKIVNKIQRIEEKVKSVKEKTKDREEKIDKLSKSILNKAFTGELI